MRITRVALSFFSVGFLAGSFEQAAGLGFPERGEPASTYRVELASLALPIGPELALPLGRRLRSELMSEPKPETKSHFKSPSHTELDDQPAALREAGDGKAAETLAAFSGKANAEPVALPPAPEAAPPPGKLRPVFAPPPPGEGALVVPEPKIAERPPEFILPFEKGRITSMFNQGRRHPAIDLAGPLGTPVYATTRKQRVVFAGWRGGYGNLVVTSDPKGRQHYYGHLHRIIARVGAVLEQGETLGLLGTTGRSTGPHVHYEVRTPEGRHLDPSTLLFAGLSVARGHAWNTPRPALTGTRLAATGQPRPR